MILKYLIQNEMVTETNINEIVVSDDVENPLIFRIA